MEMLILAMVIAAVVKNATVDTVAMATGKTPPSHTYRMAKLREQAAREQRRLEADPDTRGGLKMLARHWYLDACEDVDHWRAHRHATKPERKAAREKRRRERERFIREWAAQYVPDLDQEQGEPRRTPNPGPGPQPRRERPWRRRRRTTTTEEEEVEVIELSEDTDLVPFSDQEQGERLPLPHRRMVLMTMLANGGYEPDTETIAQMTSEEVDAAIAALVAHERATRETAR